MSNPTIVSALQQFEAAEANLAKLERLWEEIYKLIPSGVSFGPDSEYEDRCRTAAEVLNHLPKIDGWKPELPFMDLDDLAQHRFDCLESGEPLAEMFLDRSIQEPGRELREYRFRFNKKRRALGSDAINGFIDLIDGNIRKIRADVEHLERHQKVLSPEWELLHTHIGQIHTLLGGSVPRPDGWSNLCRHLRFGEVGDFNDIELMDWPQVKAGLRRGLYAENDPIPMQVQDLAELVAAKPSGPIPTKLNWSKLTDEDFERLIFTLISNEPGYENPEWLTQTRAADKGRDLSVIRVTKDALTGSRRNRVIIQCKHW